MTDLAIRFLFELQQSAKRGKGEMLCVLDAHHRRQIAVAAVRAGRRAGAVHLNLGIGNEDGEESAGETAALRAGKIDMPGGVLIKEIGFPTQDRENRIVMAIKDWNRRRACRRHSVLPSPRSREIGT